MELSIHIVADDTPSPSQSPTKEELETLQNEVNQLQTEIDQKKQVIQEKNEVSEEIISMSVPEMKQKIDQIEMEIREGNQKREELIQQTSEAEEAVNQSRRDAAEAEQLKGRIESLRRELAEIRDIANKLKDNNYFYFGRSTSITEMPWLVQISGKQIIATSLAAGSQEEKKFTGPDADTQFLSWSETRNKYKEYFVLLARPSGVNFFNTIKRKLELNGYKTGVDFIGESLSVEISNEGKKK